MGRSANRAAPGVLLAVLLWLPAFSLGYFWDDYVFLTRAGADALPAHDVFYRPIPRGLYFGALSLLGSQGVWLAHIVNLLALVAAIWLLVSIVSEIAGPRAGMLSGIAFATLAPVPGLVGWVSGCQDLFALALVLLAFRLRQSGKLVGSGIAFAGALLCKETAVAMAPALILWGWILGMKPHRTKAAALLVGGMVTVWLIVHPGLRTLMEPGFAEKPRAYVGFANLALSEFHGWRYLGALFNAPQPWSWEWEPRWIFFGLLAVALIAISVWKAPVREERPNLLRALAMAALIAIPALLLTALLVRVWARYYICLPAVGSACLIGILLSRVPRPVAAIALSLFALLGVHIRASEGLNGEIMTDRSFAEASQAIQHVETAFRKVAPTLPRGAQILVSVASSGPIGIDGTIHDGKAPQVWYRDRSLIVRRPQQRESHSGPEFLFRVTSDREVLEIDDRGSVRSSGGEVDRGEVKAILRTYARGLDASGETDRADSILTRLAAEDAEPDRSYDLRLAAMARFARSDSIGAKGILARAEPIPREYALYCLAKVLGEPTGNEAYDSAAFTAFGISSTDVNAMRYLMDLFYGSEIYPQAKELALRIQALAPGDPQSAQILEWMKGR